jgi:salicylate hydroxylase
MILDMGQGGAMAIEDAVSIATLIPRGTTVEDIPGRLRLYEMARKSRVEKVLEYTRMNGRDENDVTGPRVSRKHQSPCLNLFSSLD